MGSSNSLMSQIARNQVERLGYISEETERLLRIEADRAALSAYMDEVQGVHGGHLYEDLVHYSRRLGAGRYGSKK